MISKSYLATFLLLCLAVAPLAAQQGETDNPVLNQALALMSADQPDDAIALLEPLREQSDTDPRVLALLGVLYLETDRPADALALLEPLATAQGANPAVLYNAGRAARASGQLAKAEAFFTRSAALSPVSPAARELGILRTRQGRVEEAYRLLRPWVEVQPDDLDARMTALQAAIRLGRAADANVLLAPMDPQAPVTRLFRAQVAMLQGDAAAALAALEPVLEAPPASIEREIRGVAADAYLLTEQPRRAVEVLRGHTAGDTQLTLLLARAQRQVGEVGAAIATLRPLAQPLLQGEALRGSKQLKAAILLDYGRSLVASGRSGEGVEALRMASELNPASRVVWQSLSEGLEALGRGEEAREAGERARQLAEAAEARPLPSFAAAIPTGDAETADLRSIFAALSNDEPEQALEMARSEARRVPGDPRSRLLEVRILLSMNRTADALAAAQTAVESFPESADAVYQRGAVYLSQGETANAERDYRRALELAPNHLAAMNDLAVLLTTEGEYAEATTLLERVLAENPQDELAQQNLERIRQQQGGGS